MSVVQLKSAIKKLGPGLISGASRNDPSSIATYAKVGAQMGYGMLWTLLYSYPLLGGIQDISARVGRVTGRGIAANMRLYYSRWLLYITISLLVATNVINLGADIAAMGAALQLLIGGPMLLYSAVFVAISLTLQVCISYPKYVAVLKWLTLALFAYVATAFVVSIPWRTAVVHTLVPTLKINSRFLAGLVAALGATINPYLFFWQASQEVEEQDETPGEEPLKAAPEQAPEQKHRIKLDTYLGMAFSNLIAFFIMLTTAVILNARGMTDINSAAEAAGALRPVAGRFASALFSFGIIGTGMLAIPVLAGSAAYAVGEMFGWMVSLECKPAQAKGFYAVLIAAGVIGLSINMLPIDPIRALYLAAIINGIVVIPLMVTLMLMTTNRRVMGEFILSRRLRVMGWAATIVMAAAALGLLATAFL